MARLFERSRAKPLISTEDLPYQANAVFNAGAADLGDEVLLLLRVESCSGRSHLTVARSPDGEHDWTVGERALLHPAQGFPHEQYGVEDARLTWADAARNPSQRHAVNHRWPAQLHCSGITSQL